MVWQAVVLAIQILLLATGWLLFQRARGELSVRAAETPVLAEVRALQRQVKQLLAELQTEADRQSSRLESGCARAEEILQRFDSRAAAIDLRLAAVEDRRSGIEVEGFSDPENHAARAIVTTQGAADAWSDLADSREDVAESGGALEENGDSELKHGMPATAADRRETIYELADSGQSCADIAFATRLSEGEIETILGLRIRR